MSEPVLQPTHYTGGKIECIEYIRDMLSPEEYAGYLRGNITKYIHRYKIKGGAQDLKKARVYLDWLIQEVENGD